LGTNIVDVLSVTEYAGSGAILGIETALGAEDVVVTDGIVGTVDAHEVAGISGDGAFDRF
jgi:hypothetical protein